MFYFLSLLAGVLIPFSVLFNGALSEQHGIYFAPVVVHFTGFAVIAAIVLFARIRPFSSKQKWWMYAGGALGVLTIFANNIAFGRISVSAIMALALFGQTVAGLLTDQYGWLSTPRHPFNKWRTVGLVLTLAGIAVMMDGAFDALAIAVSFLAGVNIVVSRTLNGRLADFNGVRVSTFFNYFTGLLTSTAIFAVILLAEGGTVYSAAISFSTDVYIYLGGLVGVCLILITNYTVTRVPAFYLSLLMFIGQVFTGIIVDAALDGYFSVRILIGGVLVTLGLCADLYFARTKVETGEKEQTECGGDSNE